MNLPAGFPYPLNQDVEIPLDQIIPNPEQPRVFVIQEEIELLAASLRAKGQEVAARVRPLTEPERVAHPGAWVMLIGGHGRREAALLNQFKTLKCSIQDISPEDTLATAARDNNIRDMHWWEWYLVIERMDKAGGKSQTAIATELGQSQTRVNWALKVTKALNSAARVLVQENLQKSLKNSNYDVIAKNKGFSITEQHLLALADLEGQNQVQEALQSVLDDYLTPDQAKKLVVSMKTGASPQTSSPTAKAIGDRSGISALNEPQPAEAHEVASQAPKQASASVHHTSGSSYSEPTSPQTMSGTSTPTGSQPATAHHAHPARLAQVGSIATSPLEVAQPKHAPRPEASAQVMGTVETVALDALAGVSVIAKIKTKLKKGERPTAAETLLLAGHAIWTAIHWLGKHGFKFAKWFFKETWKLSKDGLKVLAKTWIGTIFKYACLIFVLWFGVTAYMFGISYPMTAIGTFVVHHLKWKSESHTDSSINQESPTGTSLAQPNLIARPVVSQQAPAKKAPVVSQQASSYIPTHALTDSEEDPKQFEAELAALPNYCRISDYAVVPDNTMAGDMAYRRLSDLSNSDKYSMKIGSGTQKVLNVQVSTTNLTINYQNDINSLFGGSLKMDFYWEDVSSAHCDLVTPLEVNKKPFYQLTVLVNDAKHPLIVQCSKALDMQRFVSALDNYLRAARLPAVPLGGMPYSTQGLQLNDKSEVVFLWADSPADKAGLKLKDIVWSFEKNFANPTDNKLLQAQLRTLASGSHPLYLVKPADWSKAQVAQSMNQSTRFNPKRQLVSLLVP